MKSRANAACGAHRRPIDIGAGLATCPHRSRIFSIVQTHAWALGCARPGESADGPIASRRLEVVRCVPFRRRPRSGRGRVSDEADQNYRAGSARQSERRAGENCLADSDVAARATGRGGEPARRRRRARRENSRGSPAGRLHAVDRQQLQSRRHPGRLRQRGLRSGHQLCADRSDHGGIPAPRRASRLALEDLEGLHRRREGTARRHQLRPHRPGRTAASRRRTVHASHRDEADGRLVSRRRRIRERDLVADRFRRRSRTSRSCEDSSTTASCARSP